jgi:hypothetical protein
VGAFYFLYDITELVKFAKLILVGQVYISQKSVAKEMLYKRTRNFSI